MQLPQVGDQQGRAVLQARGGQHSEPARDKRKRLRTSHGQDGPARGRISRSIGKGNARAQRCHHLASPCAAALTTSSASAAQLCEDAVAAAAPCFRRAPGSDWLIARSVLRRALRGRRLGPGGNRTHTLR